MVQSYTDMEQSMNSIERIQDYMIVPSEPAAIIKDSRPPSNWPSKSGGVEVERLVIKYDKDLEPVLKGVSFSIKVSDFIRFLKHLSDVDSASLCHSLAKKLDSAVELGVGRPPSHSLSSDLSIPQKEGS